MAKKKRSRTILTSAAAGLVAVLLAIAFWPHPTPVDVGQAVVGPMSVTVDEEGRTRVREAYVLSAPTAGRLLRVDVEPGDPVEGGQTVVARMGPAAPLALDARAMAQARASVAAAQGQISVATASVRERQAALDLATADLERTRTLRRTGNVAEAAVDRAERTWRGARAEVEAAQGMLAARRADLANARALLVVVDDSRPRGTSGEIILRAPATGRVMRVLQESETTLAAGTPILEVGDTGADLEILAELLTTDAAKVPPGAPVRIINWGGERVLNGKVDRIEPSGFTKFSALGVEEQRVNVIIRFTDPIAVRSALGSGYRVEVRVVIWAGDKVLTVPTAALFRDGEGWAVFRVERGRARKAAVTVGRNNGLQAQIVGGLAQGDAVVLYPDAAISDGLRIRKRD